MCCHEASCCRSGGRAFISKPRSSTPGDEPKVGDRVRVRARGFLPYELNFIVEAVELEPERRVVVKTIGDFDGLWSATLRQTDTGVSVDLVWEVTVLRPILRFSCAAAKAGFRLEPPLDNATRREGFTGIPGGSSKMMDGFVSDKCE